VRDTGGSRRSYRNGREREKEKEKREREKKGRGRGREKFIDNQEVTEGQ
jgi:hypothetical protein